MSRHDLSQMPDISDLIRQAFPRHPAKRLARLLDVPVETARNYAYRGVPLARHAEILAALLPALRQQHERIGQNLNHIKSLLGGSE